MAEPLTETRVRILAGARVFEDLPSGDLERLAVHSECKRFRRGAVITQRGEATDSLMVVGRGRLKGTIPSPNGNGEFIVILFSQGEVFGEVAVFDRQVRAGTAVAVTECEILFVPRTELFAVMEQRPALAIRLAESICLKLRVALELALCLRYLDVPSRLYRRLLYLARFDSRPDGAGVRIQHGLSQRELADSIGASREALNKFLGEWKRAGLIDFGRGFVVMRDSAALSAQVSPPIREGVRIGASENRPVEMAASGEPAGSELRL